jgi:hypothetical protein
MQFNGRNGCDWFYDEGQQVNKGHGTVRVYPYDPSTKLRDAHTHMQESLQATNSRSTINGVKGVSVIQAISSFDIISGFVPDFMHSTLLDVARQFANLWFLSSNHDKPRFLSNAKLQLVDSYLLAQKTPTEIARTPRSLSQRKFWKASEWKSWLLYFSPIVLKNVLPLPFHNHWMLLVLSIHALLADHVVPEQLHVAELSLIKFVIYTEKLYGVENVSFNVHLMTHLVESVRQWGPLWVASAFQFKNNNGTLLKMFQGTKFIPDQICKSFLLKRLLLSMACNTFTCQSTSGVRQLFGQLLSSKNFT